MYNNKKKIAKSNSEIPTFEPTSFPLLDFFFFLVFYLSMDIKQVVEFLKNNGFSQSESALMEDIMEKSELASLDYESFLFPLLPPLNLISNNNNSLSSSEDDDEEFVSLPSSATDFCSSGNTLPNLHFISIILMYTALGL